MRPVAEVGKALRDVHGDVARARDGAKLRALRGSAGRAGAVVACESARGARRLVARLSFALDEAADVLDLLLALPWLPPTALFPHIRNRLMEDLLVDLCELEGSDSDVEGTADEGPREPAPLCRKRAKAAE